MSEAQIPTFFLNLFRRIQYRFDRSWINFEQSQQRARLLTLTLYCTNWSNVCQSSTTKMQRLKYNWQSFNLSLISHFDIFSLITSFFKAHLLHFENISRRWSSPSFRKKNFIDTVCDYLESGKLLTSLWNQFFANHIWKAKIFEITRFLIILINLASVSIAF